VLTVRTTSSSSYIPVFVRRYSIKHIPDGLACDNMHTGIHFRISCLSILRDILLFDACDNEKRLLLGDR
jgi:hypothetical protein